MNVETMTQRMLVIDDDPLFNRILSRALTSRGYAVSGAHTAAEALPLAEQMRPQMIVLDLNLAGSGGSMSGLALVAPLSAPALTAHRGADRYASTPPRWSHRSARPPSRQAGDVDTLLAAFGVGALGKQPADSPPPSTPLSVERMEWEHIQRILLEHAGNISATARALNMHRRTLQRKLGKRPVKS